MSKDRLTAYDVKVGIKQIKRRIKKEESRRCKIAKLLFKQDQLSEEYRNLLNDGTVFAYYKRPIG